MDQFGEEHYWTKEQAECLEQWTEKAVKCKRINEFTNNIPSSSKAAGVELPEGGVISTAAVRSLVSLPEQRRKVGLKLIAQYHNSRILVATAAYY